MVANKEAKSTEKKLHLLYKELPGYTPFNKVKKAVEGGYLMDALKKVKVGQYTRIHRAFTEVIELNLDTVSVESLESVHGIGPKTARMIMLYYQPNLSVVPLDTHVLKHLRVLGYDAPKSTPAPGNTYKKWEQIFIEEAKKAGMSVREYDTYVWKKYAKSLNSQRG